MEIRRARSEDNEAICQLMADVPMGDSIQLVFERSPDYFKGAAVQSEQVEVYVLDDSGFVAGIFSLGYRSVYLNGVRSRVRYLCDLRLHPSYRSGMQLARGFRYIHMHILSKGEIMQTLILEDNELALRLLSSGRAGLPSYHPCGRYLTCLIPKQKIQFPDRGLIIRQAEPDDMAAMEICYQAYARDRQFAPIIDLQSIGSDPHYEGLSANDFVVAERSGNIVGMCAVWDQSSVRRIRVKGYSSPLLRWGRCLINLLSEIQLPKPDQVIPTVYLFGLAVDDSETGRQLLSHVCAHMDTDQLLVAGMDESDPMAVIWEGISCKKEYGRHFVVGHGDTHVPDGIFSFEVGRV